MSNKKPSAREMLADLLRGRPMTEDEERWQVFVRTWKIIGYAAAMEHNLAKVERVGPAGA